MCLSDSKDCGGGKLPVLFFPADSGQIPLFYPKIGHKYLNIETVQALERVVVNSASHKNMTSLKRIILAAAAAQAAAGLRRSFFFFTHQSYKQLSGFTRLLMPMWGSSTQARGSRCKIR
jgi:hypothetical protein